MAGRGAPIGNQNAAKARKWSNAIERAIDAYPGRAVSLSVNRGIDEAAFEFVNELMLKKDLGFFREFGDRMEGKPAQAIDVNQTVNRRVEEMTDDELQAFLLARDQAK